MARRLHTKTDEFHSDSFHMRLKFKARTVASVSALLDIASRLSKKLKPKPSSNNSKVLPNKSPMRSPKRLMSTISHKTYSFLHRKKIGEKSAGRQEDEEEEEEWGNGGVWQRSILMGDKCEPLDFSGAIYYDENGNQLNGAPPRSPRASPLPGYLQRAHKRN